MSWPFPPYHKGQQSQHLRILQPLLRPLFYRLYSRHYPSLKSKWPVLRAYPFCIKLNGEDIYKPYQNTVGTSRKAVDQIVGIEFFELKIRDETLAYGWYGKRSRLLGAINPKDGVSGIRVKAGNITIGRERLLDECFRENRFNSYMIGEIHFVSSKLIPNSRRDDFIDSKEKTLFYNSVEREIGLPISRR